MTSLLLRYYFDYKNMKPWPCSCLWPCLGGHGLGTADLVNIPALTPLKWPLVVVTTERLPVSFWWVIILNLAVSNGASGGHITTRGRNYSAKLVALC